MKAYSDDLRSRIVNAYLSGEGSQRQLAARFSVSLSFVRDLLKRMKETGKVEPKPHAGGQPARVNREGLEVLDRLLSEQPTATLTDLCRMFAESQQVTVSRATMSRAVSKVNARRAKAVAKGPQPTIKGLYARETHRPQSTM